jgi:hypothetical protein
MKRKSLLLVSDKASGEGGGNEGVIDLKAIAD